MGAILGALKGASRGLVLLVVGLVFPGVAWLIAHYAERALGTEFWSIFFGVIVLELFLSMCALFGVASEVQKRHTPVTGRAASVEEGDR